MFNIAIVEDERDAAELLEECLHRYETEANVDLCLQVFSTAMDFLEGYQQNFDIIFMDVSMPGMDGMEASRKLREIDPDVVLIFVTNLIQYAIDGYSVNALDFIVKPVNYFSFKLKIKKALETVLHRRPKTLTLTVGNSVRYIDLNKLLYVEVQGRELIYHTDSVQLLVNGTLKAVEQQLEKCGFFRCNYCYLVNLRHVTGIEGSNVTVGGSKLAISRPRKKEFLKQLTLFYGKGGR